MGEDRIMEDADIIRDLDDEQFREYARARDEQAIFETKQYLEETFYEGEFDWLLKAPAHKHWWTAKEVAEAIAVPVRTVQAWCQAGKIQGARNYGKKTGWRLPKTGLFLFFGYFRNADEEEEEKIGEGENEEEE